MDIGTEIPKDHVTQKCCILATTGSGKSYGTGTILEEYCKEDFPFVMLDVAGAHWGLAEKYRVIVLGGKQGADITYEDGEELADNIIDNEYKQVIVDMSTWDDDEIQVFTADFLRQLRARHKITREPRHIFIEEAEVVCPQINFDKSRLSLKECNAIMKRGRSVGLGCTLISQRPQDVNKRALSQCLASFILHLENNKDLDVVREMFKNENRDDRKDLVSFVEKAKKGMCLIYSPQWLGKPRAFGFRKRETFHAGYTPEVGVEVEEPEIIKTVVSKDTKTEPKSEYIYDMKKSSDKTIYGVGLFLGLVLFILTVI